MQRDSVGLFETIDLKSSRPDAHNIDKRTVESIIFRYALNHEKSRIVLQYAVSLYHP